MTTEANVAMVLQNLSLFNKAIILIGYHGMQTLFQGNTTSIRKTVAQGGPSGSQVKSKVNAKFHATVIGFSFIGKERVQTHFLKSFMR